MSAFETLLSPRLHSYQFNKSAFLPYNGYNVRRIWFKCCYQKNVWLAAVCHRFMSVHYRRRHLGSHPTSLAGVWLADTLSVRNPPPDDPTPCSCPPPSSPLGSCQVSCHPRLLSTTTAPLPHPSVTLCGDGWGGDESGRPGKVGESGLPLITLALCAAITFSSPSSTSRQAAPPPSFHPTPKSICHRH